MTLPYDIFIVHTGINVKCKHASLKICLLLYGSEGPLFRETVLEQQKNKLGIDHETPTKADIFAVSGIICYIVMLKIILIIFSFSYFFIFLG